MRRGPLVLACSLACAGPARLPPRLTHADDPVVKQWLETARDHFGRAWVPRIQQAAMLADPSGCDYSRQERRTVLVWRVDRMGRVSDVRLARSSGVRYIDSVALESVGLVEMIRPPPPPAVFEPGADSAELPFALTLKPPREESLRACGAPRPSDTSSHP